MSGAANSPILIRGPCRSPRMATGVPRLCAAARTSAIVAWCSACDPCEKLIRATFIPASIRSPIDPAVAVAGPSVHTILARGGNGPSLGADGELAGGPLATDGPDMEEPLSTTTPNLRGRAPGRRDTRGSCVASAVERHPPATRHLTSRLVGATPASPVSRGGPGRITAPDARVTIPYPRLGYRIAS